jgi:hypothetical protein
MAAAMVNARTMETAMVTETVTAKRTCQRPIILCTVQGYFWHAQQRSDTIRVMEPEVEVRSEVLSPTPHQDMRW